MEKFISLILFLVPLCANATNECAKNPTNAYEILLNAYKEENIEKAVKAIDFNEWNKFNIKHVGVEVDPNELKEVYKMNLEKSGFPDYSSSICNIVIKQKEDVTIIEHICKFEDTAISYKTSLIAVKSKCGWKLAGPYLPNKALK